MFLTADFWSQAPWSCLSSTPMKLQMDWAWPPPAPSDRILWTHLQNFTKIWDSECAESQLLWRYPYETVYWFCSSNRFCTLAFMARKGSSWILSLLTVRSCCTCSLNITGWNRLAIHFLPSMATLYSSTVGSAAQSRFFDAVAKLKKYWLLPSMRNWHIFLLIWFNPIWIYIF